MTVEAVKAQLADPAIASVDRRMASWTAGIVLLTLTLWVSAKHIPPLEYTIYSLPFTIVCAYCAINRAQLKVDVRAAIALAVYLVCASTAIAGSFWFDFYAIRDVAIISGYLILFLLWFRAPPSIADMALTTLALAMAIEVAQKDIAPGLNFVSSENVLEFFGISNSFQTGLIGSHGILESNLGFPLGLVFLFYLHERNWRRALVAGVLLFLAFKRITFLGVALAVGFGAASTRLAPFRINKIAALAVVLALSFAAVFSTQLFENTADSLDMQQTSANSISVGRYDIAVRLWAELDAGSLRQWIVGSGPGSADAVVSANSVLSNPHNDWLKVLFDYGVVGFAGIHLVLFLNLARHPLGLMLYIYNATLMMTDNIFIYMFYHPFMVMMMWAARR